MASLETNGGPARAYHHRVPAENSPLRGRIHLRGLSLRQLQTACSPAADHTFHQVRKLFVNQHFVDATTGTRIQVFAMLLRDLSPFILHDLPYFRLVLFALGWDIVRR